VEYVLQAETYEELSEAVGTMMGEASKLGYLVNLDSDLRLNKPQLDIKIDRERAAGLGVSVADIGTTLETFLAGRQVTNFNAGRSNTMSYCRARPGSVPLRPRSRTSISGEREGSYSWRAS